jgi:hypothetical protein
MQTSSLYVKRFGIHGMSFTVQFKEISTLPEPDVIELLVALLEELFARAF